MEIATAHYATLSFCYKPVLPEGREPSEASREEAPGSWHTPHAAASLRSTKGGREHRRKGKQKVKKRNDKKEFQQTRMAERNLLQRQGTCRDGSV